jgi:hypothetical protein
VCICVYLKGVFIFRCSFGLSCVERVGVCIYGISNGVSVAWKCGNKIV